MNWKLGLPAAALIVTLMPTGAFSRNHHILDGLSPSSSLSNGSPLGGGGSVLSGGTSLLGSHGGSLTSGLTNGVASVASPVANTFTSGLTGHGLFNTNNNGILNNNGLLNTHKHKRSWLSRLLSSLGLGRFQNGRFNNTGSILGNSNNGIFRNLLGRSF